MSDFGKIGNCLKYYLIYNFIYFIVDKILRDLGFGGEGTVYLVEDSKFQKFAIKRIPLTLKESVLKETSVFLNRNLISDHLVHYFKHFSDEKYENIVMEYCENGNLEKYILDHPYFSENVLFHFNISFLYIFFFFFFFLKEICGMSKQILLGLSMLHTERIIHGDIKPQNILLSRNNIIKICDFGSIKTSDINNTEKPIYTLFLKLFHLICLFNCNNFDFFQ
jgi:serine/threonine protein kinase